MIWSAIGDLERNHEIVDWGPLVRRIVARPEFHLALGQNAFLVVGTWLCQTHKNWLIGEQTK